MSYYSLLSLLFYFLLFAFLYFYYTYCLQGNSARLSSLKLDSCFELGHLGKPQLQLLVFNYNNCILTIAAN